MSEATGKKHEAEISWNSISMLAKGGMLVLCLDADTSVYITMETQDKTSDLMDAQDMLRDEWEDC